jgi:hypothetical protein
MSTVDVPPDGWTVPSPPPAAPAGRWARRPGAPADLGASIFVLVLGHIIALGVFAILASAGWRSGACLAESPDCPLSGVTVIRYLVDNFAPFLTAVCVLAGGCTLATVRYGRSPLAAGFLAAGASVGIVAAAIVVPILIG